MSMLRTVSVSVVAVTIALAAACTGSTTVEPTAPSPAPAPAPPANVTITITAAGVTPKSVTVPHGGTITYVNNDTVAHFPASNPHPVHTDCPDIIAGSIAPGQTKTTSALNVARTCGYHDHNNPTTDALKGTVTVQ